MYLYCFGPKHKFERNGPKDSFWRSSWIRKILYGIFFCKAKTFRLHAILHDAAGSVETTTHKGLGWCYVLPSFPSSCFLAHLTGLFLCLYVNYSLHQYAKTFNIMSCFGYWVYWKQKGYEKCKLLSEILKAKVTNLDDYASSKIQKLIFKNEEYDWRCIATNHFSCKNSSLCRKKSIWTRCFFSICDLSKYFCIALCFWNLKVNPYQFYNFKVEMGDESYKHLN